MCLSVFVIENMSGKSIDVQVIRLGERHDIEGLQKLIAVTSIKSLQAALTAKMGHNDCASFWNYLLLSFDANNFESREKRFACVKCFLENLLKIELSYKQTYDLITRLCQDLETLPSEQLVEIYEHCVDGIRLGDPKCVGWKDLLPETVKTMSAMPELNVNGVSMTGMAYREIILRNLCTMKWPAEVITPIANMFKDLNLSNNEIEIVLKKFCIALDSLSPTELPALCFQIFSMCTTALQIMTLLLAFEKYFHRYYYKKLFADMNSNSTDFDSIDKFSDKELREAEETILHHLNYCTQFKITELQMCVVLRNFQATPDVILTPFMLSAIISVTAANREPDSRLSTSILLPFLRSVIKNNNDERILSDQSVWCRDSLQRKEVDLVQLFTVLIEQNKEGKDVITPGLVNLAFVLLKTRNNSMLNNLAIAFLIKFVRKRFIFGQGVVKKLVEWMIVEQEQCQYSECLTQLSVADTFTVSECVNTINYFMDFLLWIPGEQAMRMMSFILPILKISPIIRDAFIEILRKAMNSSDDKTRHMAIYGFCMILKQLNNSNSQRSQSSSSSSFCTQHSISGFSLMSQATLGNRSNPQRHFDMLTLEIIGVLRNCFNQTVDIKITLYENLQRAVELNSKLTPHVLQFIDWHFRSYFEVSSTEDDTTTDVELSIKFDKALQAKDLEQNQLFVNDNLGHLILFVAHCLYVFDKYETDYDTREMKRLLKLSVEKVVSKELKWQESTGSLTHYKHALISQEINFIEGLMAHMILASKQTNDNVKFLSQLFREHQKLYETMKKLTNKKSQKKSKNDTEASVVNVTINGVAVSKIDSEIENIWDLDVIEKLLRLQHEDIVPFAAPHNTTSLRSNVEFVRYVLAETTKKIEAISLAPEYKQLSHSKRVLKYLTDITKVIYERCIKRLADLWRDFDMKSAELAAECFQQCLQTADKVYKKNFMTLFVKGFDIQAIQRPRELPTTLHNTIDEYMKEMNLEKDKERSTTESERIPAALLFSLEVLYDNIPYDDSMTTESYAWLLKFCKDYAFRTRQLCIAHKLLFTQRQKTHSGAFYNLIAKRLSNVLGRINDDVRNDEEDDNTVNLKSINFDSAGFCLQHFFAVIRKQIQDVEYFIVKANCSLYKHRVISETDRDMSLASIRSLQRSICTQMVHISNALYELTNVCIPLGPSMDGVLKLLMQHYICLKNLAKHFLSCVAQISLQGSKFELLLRVVGKPLPARVYAMITYIESNILDHEDSTTAKKKINPKADKDKVLRETKQIPKLILCMENFNKHVIILSKKDKDRLANFLHYGISRDFRVRSEKLRAAISRTLSHNSQIETNPSEQGDENDEETLLEQMEAESALIESNNEEINENESTDKEEENEDNSDDNDDDATSSKSSVIMSRSKRTRRQRLVEDNETEDEIEIEANTPTPDDVLEDLTSKKDEPNSRSQLLRNLKKVNTKAKKRALESEPDVASLPIQPQPMKRRRGRSGNK